MSPINERHGVPIAPKTQRRYSAAYLERALAVVVGAARLCAERHAANGAEQNQKLGDDVFKLKTTGKTKWVRPQG